MFSSPIQTPQLQISTDTSVKLVSCTLECEEKTGNHSLYLRQYQVKPKQFFPKFVKYNVTNKYIQEYSLLHLYCMILAVK